MELSPVALVLLGLLLAGWTFGAGVEYAVGHVKVGLNYRFDWWSTPLVAR